MVTLTSDCDNSLIHQSGPVCVCVIFRVEFKLSDLPGMVAISSLNQ